MAFTKAVTMNDQERGAQEQIKQAISTAASLHGAVDAGCSRMSARSAIECRCEQLAREVTGLHALLRALPQDMSRDAEEALWMLVMSAGRR